MNRPLKKLIRRLSDQIRILPVIAARPVSLSQVILVGTHHKTGTVWLLHIFKQICRELGLRFEHGHGLDMPHACDVYLSYDSCFQWTGSPRPCKGVHLIRDPRDVLVSACFYHARSQEAWLHVKQDEFGGLTYQEKINSFVSLDDKISFEMEHAFLKNLQEMVKWDYQNPDFLEIKYEQLINDENLLLFHKMFTFLGFPGRVIPTCLRVAHDKSLFSGKVGISNHIRSGKVQDWDRYLNNFHKKRFLELFGDALVRLGYETNDSWVGGRGDGVLENL